PQVSSGAYEWWHFDSQDDHNGYSFSTQFYAGNPLSPYYQQTLRRYLKETRSPLIQAAVTAPPRPLDFCGVVFRVFPKSGGADEFIQEFTPGQLKASEEQAAVLLGPNRFHWDASGDPPAYVVTLQGKISKNRSLRARLFFIPEKTSPLHSRAFANLPSHTWIVAAPRCRVEGTIQWCDRQGDVTTEIPWAGSGYHDHHFGTVPLDRFLKSWNWGHAHLGSKTLIYSYQEPLAADEKPLGFRMMADKNEFKVGDALFKISRKRRSSFFLPYAQQLEFTGSDPFQIRHKKILSDQPFALTIQDQVQWIQNGEKLQGFGFSNLLYPPRFSNRLFYPLLKGLTQVLSKPRDSSNNPLPTGDVSTQRPDLPSK
ncbi:MAG: hypothetical protein ACREL1_02025, partial [bacterium]